MLFLDTFDKLFNADTFCTDDRYDREYASFKYYFAQCGGEEVLEKVQMNFHDLIYAKA